MPQKLESMALCFMLAAAGIASGCGFGVARFNAEAKSVATEAHEKFPAGADAQAFEEWFATKGGQEANGLFTKQVSGSSCAPRAMVVSRVQGCMNYHVARYCVNTSGQIESLAFETRGHC